MSTQKIYTEKAKQIIKESIKTAVYIDEKAWNSIESEPFDSSIEEHLISRDLHSNFKGEGIKLNIHKFEEGEDDLSDKKPLKDYLFNKTDLVILDWDLDETAHKERNSSLKLLSEIIAQPNIHFCSIYSSSGDFENIIKKVWSFFSGVSKEQYDLLRTLIEQYEDIQKSLSGLDITKKPTGELVQQIMKLDNSILPKAKKILGKDFLELIIDIAIAIDDNLPKSEKPFHYQREFISNLGHEYTLLINNTIITILKKKDNQPSHFINNFSNHISADRSKSFFKLLGLNMQNEFSQVGAFINPDILNIQLDTFLHHRRQINSGSNQQTFDSFIKDVLIKNAELNLGGAELSLLDNDFLNAIDEETEVDTNQLAQINCFYNGAYIDGDRDLNFGDIFVDENNTFYLCITALCDCVIRDGISNINFKYHFVMGRSIKLEDGIAKGDGGYISYIDNETCIAWTPGEYIKPIQIYIPNPNISSGEITALDWKDACPLSLNLKYVFSLKQNYCQRIANHTFTHPVRVGVDFAKR